MSGGAKGALKDRLSTHGSGAGRAPRGSVAAERRRMEFRILGPLEARREGRPVRLGAGKQRSLLAILLVHANEVVPSDRLIEELWEAEPPPTAAPPRIHTPDGPRHAAER